MGRNKYPEETVKKILDVSLRLFMEKGYEQTYIQDIIDNLGGLTKGAIYHHFKTKEDIMLAVLEREFDGHDEAWLTLLQENNEMTGMEKLREMFWMSISGTRQNQVFSSAPSMLKNPKMLTLQMKSIMEDSAPTFVKPIIEQGVEDGSIKTKYPGEMAEVILLLLNMWVTPMVFPADWETLSRRMWYFNELFSPYGRELFDERLQERVKELGELYQENWKKDEE